MSSTCLWRAAAAASFLLFATVAAAQGPGDAARSSPLVFGVSGGAVHQMDTDLDSGGGFSVTRGYIEPSATYALGPLGSVGLAVGYGYSAYDSSPGAFLGGQKPWGGVNDLSLSIPIRWAAAPNLQIFLAPSLRFDWENGTDMTDGLTAGGIFGASWRVTENLAIGPGLGIFSGLEEDLDVFPILLLDWEFVEKLSLKTGSGLGASRGPELTLDWQASDDWSFGVGARYEKIRFRLDDTGPAPGGVGEDRAVPVFLTGTWRPMPKTELTAIAGIETFGKLRLENSVGTSVGSTKYDPSLFLGFAFSARF